MNKKKFLFLVSFLLFFLCSTFVKASTVEPPYAIDAFPSHGELALTLLPTMTGLPSPIIAPFSGIGPSVVHRETVPFVQDSKDTIDIEMVSMNLVGSAGGIITEIRAGSSGGFFGGLNPSLGQIQEPGGPPSGGIDFPADSFFDVFFDIWIDFNSDNLVALDEVIRNTDSALRIYKPLLTNAPAPVGTQYSNVGKVLVDDPLIGSFGATVHTSEVDFFPIDQDGNVIGPAFAFLSSVPGTYTHTVTPEPTTLLLFGFGF